MSLANRIALWAAKLRDICALGQEFSSDFYDQERYRKIQEIVTEMLAFSLNALDSELEQIKAPYLSRPTPLVGVMELLLTMRAEFC